MLKPNINTTRKAIPMIYAYTTPEIVRHNGWTKIGYTEQDVETRIKQQTQTADIRWNLEWKGNAVFDDGSAETFTDKDFHAYLRKTGVENEPKTEWFRVSGEESRSKFYTFRENRGILIANTVAVPYKLREEQSIAVNKTIEYIKNNEKGEFLWNAKPRFGKTLAVYDFCKKIEAKTVLIVTNRPAISNSWYSDYIKFIGNDSEYLFVSETDSLRGKIGVHSRNEYINIVSSGKEVKCIEFVSLQDLKGSVYFGGEYNKLEEIKGTNWDVLVVDEAHEGVDTYKTDVAFDRINRKFTLHLSGTPFKALANSKFNDDAIFNWTYADEQAKKRSWDETLEEENPYAVMPVLNLYTYQMSEIIRDELIQGIEIQGETEEYAFDLNEFFSTNNTKFVYESSVDKFLDALTRQEKFPFSTDELRNKLKHTFWLLDRVDSAKALSKKLKEHPVFKDYEIVLAAGDGKVDEEDELKNSYKKVVEAINKYDKTITLSVGQLTTGVTIPEWSAVLMLSNVKSPALYMQAAFRAQNPCLYNDGGIYERKENAYVFDFDPARTLTIFEQFANDLAPKTSSGKGNLEERKNNIKTLLNFFPVIGEDENGELIELDAEKVLSIPRKIRSVEVVKRGFMSNFLFQNISQVFGGVPKEVMDIINTFEPIEEPTGKVYLTDEVKEDLQLDSEGNVSLNEGYVIGKEYEVFGDKIYDVSKGVDLAVENITDADGSTSNAVDKLKEFIHDNITKDIVEKAKVQYGDELKSSEQKRIEGKLNYESNKIIDKTVNNYHIEKNILENERTEALQSRDVSGKSVEEINKEFEVKQKDIDNKLQEDLSRAMQEFIENSKKETVKTIETNIKEKEKDAIENGIRDHLRGFSRTIPSFLMAYGDDTVTLATFDNIIPEEVFEEVTSITLEQFRFLRDGGNYTDEETGEEKMFKGNLFDPVVFDDSVKEFLALKKKLADYFDEKSIEDIFDYIPPQKTNQIFTPKKMVKKMVDMLEEENPGCFDMPDKTFIDLYMKSGLYIAEIVKRLYQSEKMKELYPAKEERLKHIFEKQVYGLAPTEIIYKIATSFILGFDEEVKITKHNFRKADALPYAKEGKLNELLDELFEENVTVKE